MTTTKWVLIDETNGAACSNGETLNAAALAHIAEAVAAQLNKEFAAEYGGTVEIRVGSGPSDVQPDEYVYAFQPTFPSEPGASAYHDLVGGKPVSYCAVTTCESLLGVNGVSVDVSHELCEAQGDPGCNRLLDDTQGNVHADEKCDAVEEQQYAYTCSDGTVVCLSNFLLQAWGIPGASGPYDYMCQASIAGAAAPPGPMQTVPSGGANYQIEAAFSDSAESQVMAKPAAKRLAIVGKRRKGQPHWSSRAGRRLGIPVPPRTKAATDPDKTIAP